jgi:hypothetical protein
MHAVRAFLFVVFILSIGGCAGIAPPSGSSKPIVLAGPSEFLYVGTSQPGLVKYGITLDGELHALPGDGFIPPICSPELSVSRQHVFSLSQLCASSSQTELRRFTLDVVGGIEALTPPLSLPGLPSASGSALSFIVGINGKFAYAASIAPDLSEHITPVQIGSEGELTVIPPGLSWPPLDPFTNRCSEEHLPDAVVETPTGAYLSIRHEISCADQAGPTIEYLVYKVDDQTGAIGDLLEVPLIAPAPESIFATYSGTLLLIGSIHPLPGFESGTLELHRVLLDGPTFATNPNLTLLQECQANHPACAHPVAGTFHPSGKWLFVADRQAGGIWSVPVNEDSFSPEQATFLPTPLADGIRFAFAFEGKYLYVAQQNGTFAEIQGFQVNDANGALTPLNSQILHGVKSVTSMIALVPEN